MSDFFYKILKKLRQAYLVSNYYRTKFQNCLHINCNNKELYDKNILDIVTVSFNNEYVISYQIKLLKRNILDPYFYTIIDNSVDSKKQKKILKLCKRFNIGYIRAPINPYTNNFPSASHGSTLNWIYKNYLKPRKANFFGVIDHDIFPIRSTRIISPLKKQYIYGHLQERKEIWYLWAGFCFFNFNFIKDKKINFMPNDIADTGCQNYYSIFTNIKKEEIYFPKHKYHKLREGNIPQSDMVEYIGDWMHTFNASGWKVIKNKNKKNQLVKNLLDKYLKKSKNNL